MTWNCVLPKETLEGYRKAANATQEEMAHHMHLPLRTYEDLVTGKTQMRPVHSRAAEGALLFLARKRDDTRFLPPHLVDLLDDLAAARQKAVKLSREEAFASRWRMAKIVGVYKVDGTPVSVSERPLGEAIRLIAEGTVGHRTGRAQVFTEEGEGLLNYMDCVAVLKQYGQRL
ncbi:hypothetical protein [Mesorhizobium sp. M7A.F.Ca.US.010.02.1.1]|uniref:hypothetical protein n=1 Tax=Mesorhizobium sp. M7A.F.Ca.US.010.02.1.1 TaxID=2496743 RepID=UPI000FD55908|nr:hypothetical protein [Mesorhizobium sp. M7A.F.Ca.US.010.02.1.1]RUW87811.1 hypothetical protein EOA19_32505 [Mesorhizobium sp. M7A.F.Ca.US.010.02.1.1]